MQRLVTLLIAARALALMLVAIARDPASAGWRRGWGYLAHGQEVQRLGFDLRSVSPVASSTSTLSVFFEAITLASCFDATAVALTPSGETVTTKYGIPDFGG